MVTKLLAELVGYELVPIGTVHPQDPHEHLSRIIQHSGEVTAAIARALGDGKISKHEAGTLKREAHEAIEALHEFVAQMSALIDGGEA